jgi:hypothetical protein
MAATATLQTSQAPGPGYDERSCSTDPERKARERLGGFRHAGPWEEDRIMNDQPAQPTTPSKSPAPADALAALSVRELIAELTNLQGRLNHDAAGGGYQKLPGQTRRRAALVQREHQIVSELRRRRSPVPPPQD